MQLALSGWGNSLGLRIPKSIAKILGIGKGSKLALELEDGKLVLSPLGRTASLKKLARGIDLKTLVSRVTSGNMPDESDLEDSPVGQEIW